ncbi:MAG: ATP-dependent helicase [Geitlerinemataceae cyanobacterium]
MTKTPLSPNSATPPTTDIAGMRQQAAEEIRRNLRPGQREMADWQGGPLAVSAVPGSGKSTGMAAAVALAIDRFGLHPRRQLVVVTFTRSAAANLKQKIRQNLKKLSLPLGGFATYTLHGLALHIATRHPDRSQLNLEELTILAPDRNHRIIRVAVEQWIAANPRRFQMLLEGREFDGEETERLRRQSVLRTEVLPSLAQTVVREAKSSGLLPEDLRQMSTDVANDYPILQMAAGLYENYQKLLRSRNAIDYDDMILSALRVLEDDAIRRFWQTQVFGVFEDEAQDSSPLQSRLLTLLASDPDGKEPANLVRVGDPNQAINSTFTPADPIYFRNFCQTCQTQGKLATIDRAGRSTQIVMDAANFMLDWVNQQWQQGKWRNDDREEIEHQRNSYDSEFLSSTFLAENSTSLKAIEPPFQPQHIHPVSAGDPQENANPKPEGLGLEIYTPEDVYQTIEFIGKRTIELFEENPKADAAVLVRTNDRGRIVVAELERLYGDQLKVYDAGSGDRRLRVPREILTFLQFIDRPHSPDRLKAALTVLVDRQLVPAQDLDALASLPEQFLYPGPLDGDSSPPVQQARRFCCGLLRARIELPLSGLIAFLALTLQYDRDELATAEKVAERAIQQTSGDLSLSSILTTLIEIVSSERFEPVETETAESLHARSGQLTVITAHKAKGLDWDYVFLPFLHAQTLPGRLRVIPQSQFLGDLTLAEVARAQIRVLLRHRELREGADSDLNPGRSQPFLTSLPSSQESWDVAGQLKIAEEFRLLYVAMTRAKRLLWMSAAQAAPFTWNKPENLTQSPPAEAIVALGQHFPCRCDLQTAGRTAPRSLNL